MIVRFEPTQIKFFAKLPDKYSEFSLCAGLRLQEFQCQCKYYSCKRTMVTDSVVASYEAIRELYGKAITIRSGFRCQKHNYDVGGVGDSKHKLGLAIDLAPVNGIDLDLLETIANGCFDAVLRYKDFIHCHNKEGLE